MFHPSAKTAALVREKRSLITLFSGSYSGDPPGPANLQALKTAFQATYPQIKLDFVRGTDADINPRVETENKTGKGTADVHMLTDGAWIGNAADSAAYSTGLVGPDLDSPEIEPEKSVINDRFSLTSAAVFALGWNTDAVPGGLTAPHVFDQPRVSRQDRDRESDRNRGVRGFVPLLRQRLRRGLLEATRRTATSGLPECARCRQALTSGEISVTPSVQPLVTEVAAGAPVDWTLPPSPWGTPWYSHVLKVAPHPNAAQVLANFMVTREGQAALNSGYAAALPDIPGAVARAQEIASPNTDDLTPEKIEQYSQGWAQLFQS